MLRTIHNLASPHPNAINIDTFIQMLGLTLLDYVRTDAVPSNDVMNAGRALQKMFINILIVWTRDGENIYVHSQHYPMFWLAIEGIGLEATQARQEAALAEQIGQLELQED